MSAELVQRLLSYSSTAPPLKKSKTVLLTPVRHRMGVLFLCREDGITNLKLWEQWKEESTDIEVQFFAHSKAPERCKYDIEERVETARGEPSLVRAALLLLNAARDCDACVLVSGDTIPLKSPRNVWNVISGHELTLTEYREDNPACDWHKHVPRILDDMNYKYSVATYHYQFFALKKSLIRRLIDKKDEIMQNVVKAYDNKRHSGDFAPAPDEVWLNFAGHLVDADAPVHLSARDDAIIFTRGHIVYCQFDEACDHATDKPTITDDSHNLVQEVTHWLFARKFKGYEVSHWKDVTGQGSKEEIPMRRTHPSSLSSAFWSSSFSTSKAVASADHLHLSSE